MAKKVQRTNWKQEYEDAMVLLKETRGERDRALGEMSRQSRESSSTADTINQLRLRNQRGAMQMHAAAEQLETLGKTHAAALLHAQAVELAA